MFCRIRFSRRTLKMKLGTRFVRTTLDPQTTLAELVRQKQQLPGITAIVAWTVERERILLVNRTLPRGDHIRIPEKPVVSGHHYSGQVSVPCAIEGCRGHISLVDTMGISVIGGSTCSACSYSMCTACRCAMEPQGHVCDPAAIDSLAEILSNTKPCPVCSARINKSEGCDHMMCTGCNTHFSWKTLRVHTTIAGTNHPHYAVNRARETIRALRDPAVDPEMEVETRVLYWGDRIPYNVFSTAMKKINTLDANGNNLGGEVFYWMYALPHSIRDIAVSAHMAPEVAIDQLHAYHETTLVKFARGLLTEPVWSRRIVAANVNAEYLMATYDIMSQYMASAYLWQSALFHQYKAFEGRWTEDPEVFAALTHTYESICMELRMAAQTTNVRLFDAFEERLESGKYLKLHIFGEPNPIPVCYHRYTIAPYAGESIPASGKKACPRVVAQKPLAKLTFTAAEQVYLARLKSRFSKHAFALDTDTQISVGSKIVSLWAMWRFTTRVKHFLVITTNRSEKAFAQSIRNCGGDGAFIQVIPVSHFIAGRNAQPRSPYVCNKGSYCCTTNEWANMARDGMLLVVDAAVLDQNIHIIREMVTVLFPDTLMAPLQNGLRENESRFFLLRGDTTTEVTSVKEAINTLDILFGVTNNEHKINYLMRYVPSELRAFPMDTVDGFTTNAVRPGVKYTLWPTFGVDTRNRDDGTPTEDLVPVPAKRGSIYLSQFTPVGSSRGDVGDECFARAMRVVSDVYNTKKCMLVTSHTSIYNRWVTKMEQVADSAPARQSISIATPRNIANVIATANSWYCISYAPTLWGGALILSLLMALSGESVFNIVNVNQINLLRGVVLLDGQEARIKQIRDPSTPTIAVPAYSLGNAGGKRRLLP